MLHPGADDFVFRRASVRDRVDVISMERHAADEVIGLFAEDFPFDFLILHFGRRRVLGAHSPHRAEPGSMRCIRIDSSIDANGNSLAPTRSVGLVAEEIEVFAKSEPLVQPRLAVQFDLRISDVRHLAVVENVLLSFVNQSHHRTDTLSRATTFYRHQKTISNIRRRWMRGRYDMFPIPRGTTLSMVITVPLCRCRDRKQLSVPFQPSRDKFADVFAAEFFVKDAAVS